MTRRKPDPVNPGLVWPQMPDSWKDGVVQHIWEAARQNPHREFWEQSDVSLLFATCAFHHSLILNSLEPNAAGQKLVFDRYDALNLSLRGRVLSGLSTKKAEIVPPSDESVQKLGDAIKGKMLGGTNA